MKANRSFHRMRAREAGIRYWVLGTREEPGPLSLNPSPNPSLNPLGPAAKPRRRLGLRLRLGERSRGPHPNTQYPIPSTPVLLLLLSSALLLFPQLPAQGIDADLQIVKKALDPEAAIDLDGTLEAIETLRKAKSDAERIKDVVEVLAKLLERKEPVQLSEGRSRVPPLMLLKAEAVGTLHHLRDARALGALQAFRTRAHATRFYPEEAVEQAIEDLSAAAAGAAEKKEPQLPPGAWRERWKKTEEGLRFLKLADQMAYGSHGEANAARDQLLHSGNPVVPFLTDCLLHHEHFVGRRSSAYLLGWIDDPWTVPDLIKALDEKHENPLWTIIYSLGLMEDQRATEKILPLLDHQLDRIRVAAAQALARLQDPRSVEPLMAHFGKYETGRSLARAAEALGEIGDRRAMPLMLKKMVCKYVVIREYAAMAYGKLATEEELEGLLTLGLDGKLDAREIQLAFEEHFETDFPYDDEAPVEQQIEALRQRYQQIKEEGFGDTRSPERSATDREIEEGPME